MSDLTERMYKVALMERIARLESRLKSLEKLADLTGSGPIIDEVENIRLLLAESKRTLLELNPEEEEHES